MPTPPIVFRNSIAVTSAPSRPHTEPNSKPITPAPIRPSRRGTSFSLSAPVDETIVSSSTSMPGNGVTSEPVAIMMFLVLIVSSLPSPFFATTVLGPVIVPKPLMCVILFFLNSCAIPPGFEVEPDVLDEDATCRQIARMRHVNGSLSTSLSLYSSYPRTVPADDGALGRAVVLPAGMAVLEMEPPLLVIE
uniref:Uncharacterized protein n=1 Tax=Anopheles farauti TaxID=69004 RepID=A0A182QT11_9DIPT